MENFNITLELIKKRGERKASRGGRNPEEGYYVPRLKPVCDWLFTDGTDRNGVTYCNRLSYNNLQTRTGGLEGEQSGWKAKSLACVFTGAAVWLLTDCACVCVCVCVRKP